MTEFDAVTVRGLGKTYGSGVVVGRLDFDVSHCEVVGAALPDRVAGTRDLFAASRARYGTELLEQSGLGERGRRGFSSLCGRERRQLFLVLTSLGRPERMP